MMRKVSVAALSASLLLLGAGPAHAAVLQGTPGADRLVGAGTPDILLGAGGADTLDGRRGDDLLRGQGGTDVLFDRAGDDVLRGGRGDDTFGGNPGQDKAFGGPGDDLLLDDAGVDRFSGGAGDDLISVPGFGPGPPGLPSEPDVISCGRGNDRAVAHPADLVATDCEEVDRLR